MNIEDKDSLAIIGMSCRFPDAENYNQFWENLLEGKNSIREIPKQRFDMREFYSPDFLKKNSTVSKWGGLLEEIEFFDHKFFGMLPQQAKSLDPQCRLLLQEVWHCLEDAAVKPKLLQKTTTAVYVGFFSLDHFQHLARESETDMYGALGNYPCMLANQVSHFLDLRGPSISIDSACASSFSALHHAKLALRTGECEYSIIGGVNLISHVWHHISMSKCRVLSSEGQCKTFDASANGYVRGEGVGCLLVTSIEQALKKGHHIHAVIRGSAINHCGKTPAISTPNVDAQRRVISNALEDAKVKPDQIGYIETHGTGTALGDAIECSALGEVFNGCGDIYVGSVKTNIGHLEAAAGIAGIVKGVMMLKNHYIPQHLNCNQLNPLINLPSTPFKIPFENMEWKLEKEKRLLGISSLGFGGVNSHVILEEYIQKEHTSRMEYRETFPLLFSAHSESSLKRYLLNWQAFIEKGEKKTVALKDIAWTLAVGRSHMRYRSAVVAKIDENGKRKLVSTEIEVQNAKSSNALMIEPVSDLGDESRQLLLSFVYSETEVSRDSTFYKSLFNESDKKAFRAFIDTSLIARAFLKLGIAPKLIVGRGRWQALALYVAGAISFEAAVRLFLRNEQERIDIKSPEYLVYQEASSTIFYPEEQDWDALRKEIEDNSCLDLELYECIQKLLPYQFALKKYIGIQAKILQAYDIDFENIFVNSEGIAQYLEKEQIPLINLAMLLSVNYIFRKHRVRSPMKSQCRALNFMDLLVGLDVINPEEGFRIVKNPELFQDVVLKPKYLEHYRDILANTNGQKKHCTFDYSPKMNDARIEVLQSFNVITTNALDANPKKDFVVILVEYWLAGVSISWEVIMGFLVGQAQLVSLPGYCFDRYSFWYEVKNQGQKVGKKELQGVN